MDKKNEKETISVEKLALSQTYTLQALINILERKGIITKAEILEELSILERLICDDDEDGAVN